MSELPTAIEPEKSGGKKRLELLSPEMLEAAGIPNNTFQFDYNGYVEKYEADKAEERSFELRRIAAMSEELDRRRDTDSYANARQAYDDYVHPINRVWGQEFDADLINILAALLILNKDITFVVKPGTELFWFDRLEREIHGIPYDQDEHFIDERKKELQAHPGRPDMDSIKLHVYELLDSTAALGQAVLARSINLAA